MQLITEISEDLQFITEEKGKDLFIEGVFLQSNIENRNKRVYPPEVLEREVKRYTDNYISKNRAFGELGHPQGPTINLERVSHMIKSLTKDGDNYIGKAKIMKDTPYGAIVANLIKEGASLGVSSRGMGSVTKTRSGPSVVQDDFYLATAADIVADPSAPDAFVNGIMEGKAWVWENGVIRESQLDIYKTQIQSAKSKQLEEVKLKVFENFFSSL
jgi:hypothetical protein|tara:strand:+ start:27325 stop:27969 length:645 start_codon:yes stop_codon:yes gene_type:complete